MLRKSNDQLVVPATDVHVLPSRSPGSICLPRPIAMESTPAPPLLSAAVPPIVSGPKTASPFDGETIVTVGAVLSTLTWREATLVLPTESVACT